MGITNKISTWIIMSIFRTSILIMVIMMSSLENHVEAGIVSDVLSWIGLGGSEVQEKSISENDENVVTEDETAGQINEEETLKMLKSLRKTQLKWLMLRK